MARPWVTRPPEQIRAAVILGGLVLASLGVWVVTMAGSSTEPSAPPDPWATPADLGQSDSGDPDPDAETGSGDDEATTGTIDPPSEDPTEEESDAPAAGDTVTIEFDGVCTVEVDAAEGDDPDSLRPWQFPDCDRAPVDPTGPGTRWIVIVASLPGDRFDEVDALARLDDHDESDQLLWSSHYPSLNPGYWVVFDGPFPSRTAAREAAQQRGGGSYARALSEREQDRP